jgi:hypothetical protein
MPLMNPALCVETGGYLVGEDVLHGPHEELPAVLQEDPLQGLAVGRDEFSGRAWLRCGGAEAVAFQRGHRPFILTMNLNLTFYSGRSA